MRTVHLISHTHWDREWYLTFQQFRLKLVHLIDNLLKLLEDDPGFRYFMLDGQTIMLEDYLQIRPQKEAELIKHIMSGRLLIGPWYVSPDEFLLTPESHIRNLLEGNRLCQHFGGKMQVGYLPDTFGHIGQMPQIFNGFGITSACLWRGLADQPCELTWKSPDGSSVLLAYLSESYSNAANLPPSDPVNFSKAIQQLVISLPVKSNQVLLMNGTDHMEPSEDLSAAINHYNSDLPPDKLINSSLPDYFSALRQDLDETKPTLPVIQGELRSSRHTPLLQNVLSTHVDLKQWNDRCESDLLSWVEPFSAWSSIVKSSQPTTDNNQSVAEKIIEAPNSVIRSAWKLLMQCHAHDSICGTSIDQVVKEMLVRFEMVDQINHEMIDQSLKSLSNFISTLVPVKIKENNSSTDEYSSIIIFNPNDHSGAGLIEMNLRMDKRFSKFEIVDEAGVSHPHYQTNTGAQQLISMTLDKPGFKQALGMINDGNVVGMVVRDLEIEKAADQAFIRVTLSDRSRIDLDSWHKGLQLVQDLLADPMIQHFQVKAYSDPEVKLTMLANDIPEHGYRCYWVHFITEKNEPVSQVGKANPLVQRLIPILGVLSKSPILNRMVKRESVRYAKPPFVIENEDFSVKLIYPNGTLTITDKRNRHTFKGLNLFVDGGDCGDLYNYCPPLQDQLIHPSLKRVQLERTNSFQKLVVHYQITIPDHISEDRKSRSMIKLNTEITSTITLTRGIPRIDIHTELDNQAKDHRLRVHFPASLHADQATYDGHFELVQRPIGIPNFDETWAEQPRPEVPQRKFCSVSDGHTSMTIANRGLPEVEVMHNEMGEAEIAITLLRCVGWLSRDDLTTRNGHAGPMGIETPAAQMPGKLAFDYSIIPAGGDALNSIYQAYSFHTPLKAIIAPPHPGPLPDQASMITNQNPHFFITTIKITDDDSGLIVRGFNALANPIQITLKPWKPFKLAQLVNLDESIIQDMPITEDGQITTIAEGHKIVTVKFST